MGGGEGRHSEQKTIFKCYFLHNSKGVYGVGFYLRVFISFLNHRLSIGSLQKTNSPGCKVLFLEDLTALSLYTLIWPFHLQAHTPAPNTSGKKR